MSAKNNSRLGYSSEDAFDWISKRNIKPSPEEKQKKNEQEEVRSPIDQENNQQQEFHVKRNKSREGLPSGWTRVTWVVKDEHAEIIRALHAWTGEEIKDIICNILEWYFSKPNVSDAIKESLAFTRRKKVSLKDLT